MAFERVCAVEDIGEEGMEAFFLDWEVLVVRDASGRIRAMEGTCPHEDFPLVHGLLEGNVLTCANHLWSFDTTTGKGINPPSCRLAQYRVKVEGGEVFVDVDAPPEA